MVSAKDEVIQYHTQCIGIHSQQAALQPAHTSLLSPLYTATVV